MTKKELSLGRRPMGEAKEQSRVSSLRHEINNLLAIIMLNVQMLETHPTKAKKQAKEIISLCKKIQTLLKKF